MSPFHFNVQTAESWIFEDPRSICKIGFLSRLPYLFISSHRTSHNFQESEMPIVQCYKSEQRKHIGSFVFNFERRYLQIAVRGLNWLGDKCTSGLFYICPSFSYRLSFVLFISSFMNGSNVFSFVSLLPTSKISYISESKCHFLWLCILHIALALPIPALHITFISLLDIKEVLYYNREAYAVLLSICTQFKS